MFRPIIQHTLHCAAALCLLAFASCDDDNSPNYIDGKWDPMEWETDAIIENEAIAVPADGGTYTLRCTNYPTFWLSEAIVGDTVYFYPSNGATVTDTLPPRMSVAHGDTTYYATVPGSNWRSMEKDWWKINVTDDATMTVAIAPNESPAPRSILVIPTAGDIFDYITFTQP